ncbi:MAG: acetolactate synthase large subunit, partial [bacterium]|nr:acetolactate synthase large subunit [bacterium]
QQQELFYGERYHASKFHATPDFAAVAQAFGVRGIDLEDEADPMAALQGSLTTPGPWVVNVPIHYAENVFPMVPPGGANHEMIGGGLAHA